MYAMEQPGPYVAVTSVAISCIRDARRSHAVRVSVEIMSAIGGTTSRAHHPHVSSNFADQEGQDNGRGWFQQTLKRQRAATLEHTNTPGLANTLTDRATNKRTQIVRDHLRCVVSVKQPFGMGTEIAPPGRNFGDQGMTLRRRAHAYPL